MKLTDKHKSEIDKIIVEQGGPYSAISFILNQTGSMKPHNKRTNQFVLNILEYIISVRHTSFDALNRVVSPYNIYFLDNKFHLSI